VIRRRRDYSDNFLLMDRRAIEDSRLRWQTRGLLAYLLSKPDHWEVSVTHLASKKTGKSGRDAVRSMLAEMCEYGYATRSQSRNPDGTLGEVEYTITDVPLTGLPETDNPATVNPTQVSTDIKQVLNRSNWGDAPDGIDPQAWDEWADYKRGKPAKATITKTANFLRDYEPAQQRQIVDQSIRNTWKGLFPLKEQSREKTGKRQSPFDAARERLRKQAGYDPESEGDGGVVATY